MDFAASTIPNLLYAAHGYKLMSEQALDLSTRSALQASAERLLKQARERTEASLNVSRKGTSGYKDPKITQAEWFARANADVQQFWSSVAPQDYGLFIQHYAPLDERPKQPTMAEKLTMAAIAEHKDELAANKLAETKKI